MRSLSFAVRAQRKLRQTWVTLSAFWIICLIAVMSFGVASLLAVTPVGSTIRCIFALLTVTTASVVQKLIVLEIVLALSHQRRQAYAIMFETTLR